ncbi:FAD/NAD(P)-binding protein [Vibrio vulnificus]|uniref:FAD/NAD(P)-binding protein n=1 Tax=Vibrio vulnificus TaxID=672 RepID=UPI001CDB7E43|nr:FAD/NAD(P)-binding protein [Vibrio vulnificus]MCA3903599.1 FAD/NAD(P)-binding protein [Vibrio vulnificus]
MKINIGIIGIGSRGLSVLERLISIAKDNPNKELIISIFDSNLPGCGVHDIDQRDYMFLNTMAGQMGIYPDAEALSKFPGAPLTKGYSFYDWCVNNEVKSRSINKSGQSVNRALPTDYLPRNLLARYLRDCYEHLHSIKTDNVIINNYDSACEILKNNNDYLSYRVVTSTGNTIDVRSLVMTTGHGNVVGSEENQSQCETKKVLIQGLGLTAFDLLSGLTKGRGGRYEYDDNGQYRYISSGREPKKIYLQSRSGGFFFSRPDTPLCRRKHLPVVLNDKRISYLKSGKANNQVDFTTNILPLIYIEMRAASLATKLGNGDANKVAYYNKTMAELGSSIENGVSKVTEYLDINELDFGKLDCISLLDKSLPGKVSSDEYEDWFISKIKYDLTQSNKGLLLSHEKAALEVWRDLRDQLRKVIDFRGLTKDSHKQFYSHWDRVINRLVAGPPKERYIEVLALVEAGIVSFLHQENTELSSSKEVIKLSANVESVGYSNICTGPYKSLSDLGLIRPLYNDPEIDGIEINSKNQAISVSGDSENDIYIMGPIVEGCTYYNHYIPSPGSYNRAMTDAHIVAENILINKK